jgi:4-hydroxybenzoate polyprenyltransferase
MILGHHFYIETALQSFIAFIAFSLVTSSAYVLNDILDLASDRAHSRKRNRPFASGRLSIGQGWWLASLLLLVGLMVALSVGMQLAIVLLCYYTAAMTYSLYLKSYPLIDICTLAVLYALRIVAGGVATGLSPSLWLLAFSFFFFFALAAIKRQIELVDGAASGKLNIHGRGYRVDDLHFVMNMAISSGYVSVLVLALYINASAVQELYTLPSLLWGVCLILLYWLSRMVMIASRGEMQDDPIVFAVTDHVSYICLFSIFAFSIGAALM